MRIIVSDSSALIDLRKGLILELFLKLPFEFVIPDALIESEQYTPLVNDLISAKCRNKKQIEGTLDQLLSFCGYDPAVKIYRKLCRYYSQIDRQAAADYEKIYSDMWER